MYAQSRAPQAAVVAGFAGVILLGGLLLSLPWAHQPQGHCGFLDNLFTSTSAVCVTGLIVADTATEYSRFGQFIILLLIQLGGLGIMSYAALTAQVLGRRLSLASQSALEDSIFQQDSALHFGRIFYGILRLTAGIECLGAVCLFISFVQKLPVAEAAWAAVFHAVSAFCNAGFSLFSSSIIDWRGCPLLMTVLSVLIILGGLGHSVLFELWRNLTGRCPYALRDRPHRYTYHARIVLAMSAGLILVGTLGILLFGLTGNEQSWSSQIVNAIFQSVSARTAGFNSVDLSVLPTASLFLLILLMLIGGSPGSCAGGVKTTTLAAWMAGIWSRLRGEDETRLLERRLSPELLDRARLVIGLCVLWNMLGMFVLLHSEPAASMRAVFFEQCSAFGTVGLSVGLTSQLSTIGRLWIIATMFVGRLGPLTLATWMVAARRVRVRYPEGKVMIG